MERLDFLPLICDAIVALPSAAYAQTGRIRESVSFGMQGALKKKAPTTRHFVKGFEISGIAKDATSPLSTAFRTKCLSDCGTWLWRW